MILGMTMHASPSSRSLVDLGRAVRDARERRHMTITDITARGGCSPNTWIKVERGQPVQARMYDAIAKGFGIPTELITDAAQSVNGLPVLLDVLGGVAGPAFPAPSSLDDTQLFDALDALIGEVYRRYLVQGDNLAAISTVTGRTVPRRPRVRTGAINEPAALAEAAGRTEQERPHHGMG
jgi:transcriptional regulator with XRE-family HTH domain